MTVIGMDVAKAREDFISRVRAYEKVYQTCQDDEDSSQISYIKLINVGQKIITRNCTGYLPSQVCPSVCVSVTVSVCLCVCVTSSSSLTDSLIDLINE